MSAEISFQWEVWGWHHVGSACNSYGVTHWTVDLGVWYQWLLYGTF